jgi:hypothetical protein
VPVDFPRLRRKLAALLSPLTFLTLSAQPAMANDAPAAHTLNVPEPEVRKYSSKYVLRHSARRGAYIQLIGHRSHSSHSSHASHQSHYSGSTGGHYSHYSGSAAPSPSPVAPKPVKPIEPLVAAQPQLQRVGDDFWTEGLALRPQSRDPLVRVSNHAGVISIDMRRNVSEPDANGVVSATRHDLSRGIVQVNVVQAPKDGGTTELAIVADANNWYSMRVKGPSLMIESVVRGTRSMKSIGYVPSQQAYWRMRASDVTPLFLFETSPDGRTWKIVYAEAELIPLSAVRIALSAGTDRPVSLPGTAIFTDFRLLQ